MNRLAPIGFHSRRVGLGYLSWCKLSRFCFNEDEDVDIDWTKTRNARSYQNEHAGASMTIIWFHH